MNIKLIRMGMDFYGDDTQWDMGNYRVRPTLNDATECRIPLKDGGYIAGDFEFWRKNETNNTHHDALHWEFTEYKDDDAYSCATRYHGLDKYHTDDHSKRLEPTLKNIERLLSDATGEQVTVTLEGR